MILTLYMAITSRMAGGGFYANRLWKPLPELLFSIPFGWCGAEIARHFTDSNPVQIVAYITAFVWSYLWMQTGHGTVLPWGGKLQESDRGRTQFLTPAVTRLAKLLRIEVFQDDNHSRTLNYCRLFMAVKGFLIALPVGGVVLAVLWPLAYEIGTRMRNHALSELIAGAGAGVAISLFIILMG